MSKDRKDLEKMLHFCDFMYIGNDNPYNKLEFVFVSLSHIVLCPQVWFNSDQRSNWLDEWEDKGAKLIGSRMGWYFFLLWLNESGLTEKVDTIPFIVLTKKGEGILKELQDKFIKIGQFTNGIVVGNVNSFDSKTLYIHILCDHGLSWKGTYKDFTKQWKRIEIADELKIQIKEIEE